MKGVIPTIPEIAREAMIVVGGALLAAVIVGQLPGLKAFIKDAWQ